MTGLALLLSISHICGSGCPNMFPGCMMTGRSQWYGSNEETPVL